MKMSQLERNDRNRKSPKTTKKNIQRKEESN